jgi:predicted nucleotidyltransferase
LQGYSEMTSSSSRVLRVANVNPEIIRTEGTVLSICTSFNTGRNDPAAENMDQEHKLKISKSRRPLEYVLILSTIVLGMSTLNGLGNLLFGRTRGAVLVLLYGHADQSFYTRQIAREVNASVGAVQRELENLSKVGLIVRSSVGGQVFYQAKRDSPIFREMRALVNKTIGVFSVLRSALHPLAKRVLVAFVYGSVAREEETAQSDVDLLVVGKATLDEVLSRLSNVEKSIGRPINQTVYSVAEFKSKLASGNHFLAAVLKGQKVFLLGDEDELRKVGGVRLATAVFCEMEDSAQTAPARTATQTSQHEAALALKTSTEFSLNSQHVLPLR